ncbi:MAG TPA: murein L,D-transpeptidase catalytic domain family protein [Flavisolibacter sp.]|nr:murein L,D-transpeptidase catalytic domain family protein [Flavisolibacter sp.]
MRKVYLPLSVICLVATFLLLPVVKAGSNNKTVTPTVSVTKTTSVASSSSTVAEAANNLYDSLQLDELGMTKQALVYAYKGFQKLEEKGVVQNPDVLTVIDFSQPSDKKRMYIIDVKNFKVLLNTYVAHGKNSGLEYAKRFSNRHESLQSSLGFYVTKNTYFGKHGLSLRLSGQDKGFNDNAESRAVVVHGAQYIGDNRLNSAYMGRSFGCPAVPQKLANKVINTIKNGTTLFIYHPSQQYLHGSTLLNG